MGIGSYGSSDPSYVYRRLKLIETVSGINAGDKFAWWMYNTDYGESLCQPPERKQPPIYSAIIYNVNGGCGNCKKCQGGYTTYNDLMPYNFADLEFHPRYEGKMMNFMQDHLHDFRQYLNDRTLFWIVGSKPLASAMVPLLKSRFGDFNA